MDKELIFKSIDGEFSGHETRNYFHCNGILTVCQRCGKMALTSNHESGGVLIKGELVDSECGPPKDSTDIKTSTLIRISVDCMDRACA